MVLILYFWLVAADDGVMPQTREHFDIVNLLGIENGIVVLTKTDMVSKERIEEVKAQIKEEFADSFIETAPIVETNPYDLTTYDRLREVIMIVADLVDSKKQESDIFRLSVDRAFSIKRIWYSCNGNFY